VTHDPDSEVLGGADTIWIDGVRHGIAQERDTHRGWLVALTGVTTRNDAERLQG